MKLQEKCQSIGVPCQRVYPGRENVQHARMEDYLIEKLNETATRGTK